MNVDWFEVAESKVQKGAVVSKFSGAVKGGEFRTPVELLSALQGRPSSPNGLINLKWLHQLNGCGFNCPCVLAAEAVICAGSKVFSGD
jgi:hypothetical protein